MVVVGILVGTFEPARVMVASGQRERKGKYDRAKPAYRYRGRQERQGHQPVEREPGKHRERPRDRRPDNDIRGICRVSHGGTGEPALLLMWPAEDYLQV